MKFNSLHTVLVSCFLALGFAVTACDDDDDGGGNVCDQAGKVFVDECGGEVEGGDGEAGACEGDVAAAAQCVVDFPSEYCDFLEDPLTSNGFAECIAG